MGIVVSLVTVKLGGLAAPRSAARADRRDASDQWFDGQAVMGVGGTDRDRDRQTGPLGDEMDFRPALAAIDRIRACQLPPLTARKLTESIAQRD
ncbi:hypothetical protein GCM10018953_46010 [Streptosporangium nondiastaticum]